MNILKEVIKKIFSTQDERRLKKLKPLIDKINVLEENFKKFSDNDLRSKTEEFKNRIAKGESLDNILPEAFATVREAAVRTLNMRHFDVQLIGGIVLHKGKITEMATGEGKTLVATLPAYLNALTGNGVHIITVNDYLARRDRIWMGPIYEFLGLSVGVIVHDMAHEEKQQAYNCDITYGTNNEFGFDYLRDNMAIRKEDLMQRELNYAIIDEVDSILIDESRTPLIISGPVEAETSHFVDMKPVVSNATKMQKGVIEESVRKLKDAIKTNNEEGIQDFLYLIYKGSPKEKELLNLILKDSKFKRIFDHSISYYESQMMEREKTQLLENLYFIFEERTREVAFTNKGIDIMKTKFNIDFIVEDLDEMLERIKNDETINEEQKIIRQKETTENYIEQQRKLDSIKQLLKAYVLFQKDVDYVVNDSRVIIVDEFTGRLMPGRRFSDGIHEAIEAKENVDVQKGTQTLATITFQNYFRMYKKIAGMTGTAKTEEMEFKKIYNLDTITIPTNKPLRRTNFSDIIYKTEEEKFHAICSEIEKNYKEGKPVLVGTVSIEKNERLTRMLRSKNIMHNVLNAKYHQKEAEIIAQAGRLKAVTIATNMAGRGTDIMLGGNPEFLAKESLKNQGKDITQISSKEKEEEINKFRKICNSEHDKVVELGGLHVIGSERHESRRIDNQLRGRSGRQGDPGSSRFYLSLEDDLMRIFGGDKIRQIMERFKLEWNEGEPLMEHGLVTRAIRTAQQRVEEHHFSIRKQLLDFDNVMNKQREIVYAERKNILLESDLKDHILSMIDEIVERNVSYLMDGVEDEEEALQKVIAWFRLRFPIYLGDLKDKTAEDLTEGLIKKIKNAYEEREKTIGSGRLRQIEKIIMLQVIDSQWKDHLHNMDALREGIGLRAYGQKDPLIEYQHEGFALFEEMTNKIKEETIHFLFRVMPAQTIEEKTVLSTAQRHFSHPQADSLSNVNIHEDSVESQHHHGSNADESQSQTYRREAPKVGRNEPCPCGSGKKYKHCCGR